jgi:serine/threonine-protein kinase
MADATVACPKCQSPVPADSKFCANCGASVSTPGTDTAPMPEGDELFHLLASATLGEYEIKGELGRGGMGAVYLAHEIALDRKVAIKVLPPELTYGTGITERFKREARTAAHLNHPNIIPIFRVAESEGLLFFVMKYVEGRGLDHIIEQMGKLPIPMVHAILNQVGGALGYAHRRGVIHRDVKPANIMIDEEGWAVVTDFGIAKAASAQGITATGAAIGTPYYMSPEQCSGKGVTGASDQYSLGIVTHQMLTGSLPFAGDSIMEIMKQHFMDEPPDIAPLRPDCPPALLAAVRRALAKAPAERFPSMEDFVTSLGAVPTEHDRAVRSQMIEIAKSGVSPVLRMPATPLSPIPLGRRAPRAAAPTSRGRASATIAVGAADQKKSRLWMWVAAALVVVAAGGGGAYLALRSSASQELATGTDSASVAARRPDSVAAGTSPAPARAAVVAAPAVPEPSAASGDFGTIVLREVPPGATVLVDGRRVSSLQPQVQPGRHLVEISAPGYAAFSSPILIARGGRQALTARMQPVESGPGPTVVASGATVPATVGAQPSPTAAAPQIQPPPPSAQAAAPQQAAAEPAVSPDTPGRLTVGARPFGSATLNGSRIPSWPAVNMPLLPGTYRINISAPNFEDSALVFVVRPGQLINLRTIVLRRREGAP